MEWQLYFYGRKRQRKWMIYNSNQSHLCQLLSLQSISFPVLSMHPLTSCRETFSLENIYSQRSGAGKEMPFSLTGGVKKALKVSMINCNPDQMGKETEAQSQPSECQDPNQRWEGSIFYLTINPGKEHFACTGTSSCLSYPSYIY